MKINNIVFLLFLILSLIGCREKETKIETGKVKTEEIPTKNTNTEIEKVVIKLNMAIIYPEKNLLENLCADQLSYGHSSGKVQDKDMFIDDLINGGFDFISIDISDQKIYVSQDIAIVRQIFDSEATNAGIPTHVHIGNVLIFQKQEGQWKLLARQAYKI